MAHVFKPPFEIYEGNEIADQNGHVCSADSPEIAQALLALLNRSMIPVTAEKPGLTAEQMLDWIEISLMRVRDNGTHTQDVVLAFGEAAEHIRLFRKEFRDRG